MFATSWVDNLVAVGTDVDDTTQLLNGLAMTLRNEWELTIKDGSKELLTNNTHTMTDMQLQDEWQVQNHMD